MAFADQQAERLPADSGARLCSTVGLNVWGLSYHPDKAIEYKGRNWGVGVRCYARPAWSMLGESADNQTFLQFDALRNSHGGLVIPASFGVEYNLATMGQTCKLLFLGALAVAYYETPDKARVKNLRVGPVPGLALGCGTFKPTLVFVPSASRQMLAAIAASMTVVF